MMLRTVWDISSLQTQTEAIELSSLNPKVLQEVIRLFDVIHLFDYVIEILLKYFLRFHKISFKIGKGIGKGKGNSFFLSFTMYLFFPVISVSSASPSSARR